MTHDARDGALHRIGDEVRIRRTASYWQGETGTIEAVEWRFGEWSYTIQLHNQPFRSMQPERFITKLTSEPKREWKRR